MSDGDFFRREQSARRRRTVLTVCAGVALGVSLAILATTVVRQLGADRGKAVSRPTARGVDLFRLAGGQDRQLLVLRAGPDGSGEQVLARRLFPDETGERDLAAVLVANASADAAWDVDLAATPLRFRAGEGSDWETFESIAPRLADGGTSLTDADRLRLRGLGAEWSRFRLEPRRARQVLLALPRDRRFEEVSDVQWGDTPLRRDHVDVERYRSLRQDPTAAGDAR